MAFTFSERHVADYYHHGCTVFRSILPTSLITDLRSSTEKGRAIAREKRGSQAQRLQPISDYGDRIDLKPFQDYMDLPALRDALYRVDGLSSPHWHERRQEFVRWHKKNVFDSDA